MVFTEVTFGIPGIRNFMPKWLYFRGIPPNFPLFNFAEYRRNSAEFHTISCTEFHIRILSNKFTQTTLDFFVLKTEVEFKNINFAFVYLNDPFGNKKG
jgi:hypothetical protein